MEISIYSTMIIPTHYKLKGYGGLELIAALLARYLDEQGHTVNLFASNGSYDPPHGKIFVVGEAGAEFGKLINMADNKGVNPLEAWKQFWSDTQSHDSLVNSDIVCDMSWGYYPYSVHDKLKNLCHVHHGPDTGMINKPPMEHPNLIAVGHNHAKQLMIESNIKKGWNLSWRGIQNGIDTDMYPYQEKKENYLLWISRIYYPKGPHRFIDICDTLGIKGIIAGGSFGDVKPYLDVIKQKCEQSPNVDFLGEVPFEKKVELYQNAKGVLIPSIEHFQGINRLTQEKVMASFIEPFGLITPEANSCGTPTIVLPSGGWQETMIHGYNGYFSNSDQEFCYYAKQLDKIKPKNCRTMAEKFSYKIMGENYLNLFNSMLKGEKW